MRRYWIDSYRGLHPQPGTHSGPGDVVPWGEAVEAVRRYGTHVEGCQWHVFPPGDRNCSCGLHDIIGVPDFALPQRGDV